MNIYKQQEIWTRRIQHMSAAGVLVMYRNPCPFQIEFGEFMNKLGRDMFKGKKIIICELGCELGIASLLLSSEIFERHCFDLNPYALQILKEAAKELRQDLKLHQGDMLQTSFADATFDIVFSNGVLEHFSFNERKNALRECARIVRPSGKIFIGVPNHFSLPYRFAYKLRTWMHRWPFPPEEKIKDFRNEICKIPSLNIMGILFFDKETAFNFFPKPKYTAIPIRFLDRMWSFEPYLRVVEFQRL